MNSSTPANDHQRDQQSRVMIAIALAIVIAGGLFNVAPEKFPADDGFFYLQVADHITSGDGSTFHGISRTNGYHPLWMVVCVAASAVTSLLGGGKAMLLHVVWAVQIGLLIWSVALFRRFGGSGNKHLPLGECLLVLVFVGLGSLYLTEAHLHLTALLILLLYARRVPVDRPLPWFTLGVLAGLFVLTRLDGVFVGSSLLIAVIVSRRAVRPSLLISQVIPLVIGGLVVVVPYLVYNQFAFGHMMPISGAIKSTFPSTASAPFEFFGKIMGVMTACYLLLLLTVLRRRPYRALMLGLAVGGLLHIAYCALFLNGSGQWYWVTQYLVLAFMVNDVAGWLLPRWERVLARPLIQYLLLVALLLPTVTISYLKLTTNFSLNFTLFKGVPLHVQQDDPMASLARQLNDLLPPGTAVMVYDSPGRLAYYSDLRVVPSDGLMNDFGYGEYLATEGATAYFAEHGIGYVLCQYSDQPQFSRTQNSLGVVKNGDQVAVTIYNPLDQSAGGTFVFTPDDAVLIAANPLATWQPQYSHVALWRVGP